MTLLQTLLDNAKANIDYEASPIGVRRLSLFAELTRLMLDSETTRAQFHNRNSLVIFCYRVATYETTYETTITELNTTAS